MAKMTEAEILAKMKVLEDRIKAPSVWGRVPCGVRFEDLQDKYYEDAVKLLKKHYLPEELTFRSVRICDDKEGVDEFAHNVRIWMKDKMSIAAIKEGSEKLIGCLIMRIQEKSAFSRTFSRVKLTYNPLYSSVMKFYNEIEKPVDIFEKLGVRKYLKVYIMALKHRYRHRGIGAEFLKAAFPLAASAFVPAVSGIFLTGHMQKEAEKLGFEKFNEIFYVRYLINDEVIFWDTGLGNYGAALMGYRIPDVEEIPELQPARSSRYLPGLMKDMLTAAVALCVNAHVPAISGIFTTSRLHQVAEDIGFQKQHELSYKDYKVDGKIVFEVVDSGNYGAALMAYRIPEVEELQEVEAQHSSRFNIQSLDEGSEHILPQVK